MKRLLSWLKIIKLILASSFYRMKAGSKLPGKEFDSFGRKLSFNFLFAKDYNRFVNLFCNPVSIVRYFEFPFCYQAIEWSKVHQWMDISSPRLFLSFVLHNQLQTTLDAVNPDQRDLEETFVQLQTGGFAKRFSLHCADATKLPFPNNCFDVVTSISVLEHVPEFGDSLVT